MHGTEQDLDDKIAEIQDFFDQYDPQNIDLEENQEVLGSRYIFEFWEIFSDQLEREENKLTFLSTYIQRIDDKITELRNSNGRISSSKTYAVSVLTKAKKMFTRLFPEYGKKDEIYDEIY